MLKGCSGGKVKLLLYQYLFAVFQQSFHGPRAVAEAIYYTEVSPMPANVLLLAVWTSVFFTLEFSAYILIVLVIKYF